MRFWGTVIKGEQQRECHCYLLCDVQALSWFPFFFSLPMCCQVDNLGNMFVCLKMKELIPLSCRSLPVILSAPWEPHEAAIPVDQARSVRLAFSTGRALSSHLFLSRYLSGAVAVSPAFVRPCHLFPFKNSRHTLCCYISICTWFMDISVWRNASAPLVHVKTGVPRQIWCSSNLLCSFWW